MSHQKEYDPQLINYPYELAARNFKSTLTTRKMNEKLKKKKKHISSLKPIAFPLSSESKNPVIRIKTVL